MDRQRQQSGLWDKKLELPTWQSLPASCRREVVERMVQILHRAANQTNVQADEPVDVEVEVE